MAGRCTIAFLNPNATVAMTDDMVAIARADAPEGCDIVGRTNAAAPPAIQGPEDAAACLPGLIDLFDAALRDGADAVVLGCFDDTGIEILRGRATIPVIGLGEASCRLAASTAPRFHVITTLGVSVPVIEDNIRFLGLASRCASIRASGVPVLDLPHRIDAVQASIDTLLAEDPGASIVLGCAGMSTILPQLRASGQGRLIDPVRTALAAALEGMRAGATGD